MQETNQENEIIQNTEDAQVSNNLDDISPSDIIIRKPGESSYSETEQNEQNTQDKIINQEDEPEGSSAESNGAASQAQSGSEELTEEEEYFSDEEVTDLISQVTGGLVSDPEELATKLQRLEELEKQGPQSDPMEGLSPFVKGLIEWEKAGLDPRQYVELQSLDFSKMEAKEVLWQKYSKDNSELVKNDPGRAKRMFEFEFKNSYGKLDSLDPEIDSEEIQFLQDKLEIDKTKAQNELTKWQQENSVPPKKEEPSVDPAQEQARQEWLNNHFKTVDSRVGSFEGLQIPVSENSSEDFKYAATPEVKAQIKEWMNDPYNAFMSTFYEKSDKGEVDFTKVNYDEMEIKLAALADLDGLIEKAINHGINIGAERTITTKKNTSSVTIPAQSQGATDELKELAEAFAAKRRY